MIMALALAKLAVVIPQVAAEEHQGVHQVDHALRDIIGCLIMEVGV